MHELSKSQPLQISKLEQEIHLKKQMKKMKQLVLVIEGTAALAPFWSIIFVDYIRKLIMSFCGNQTTTTTTTTTGSSSSSPNVELALVIFNTHNSFTSCFVQRSSWTGNVELFLEWLSAIHFTGGGFGDSAIAEGLAEALLMFTSLNGNQIQQNESFERHCILVAASNPNSLPTHVYRPTHTNDTLAETCLSDAETLAKSFPQCSVSLSVICPTQLPKLKAIYNAGKKNPLAANLTIDIVKNPHHLVLVSENFMKACAALSPSEISRFPSNQIPIKTEATSVPLFSEPPPTSVSPVNQSLLNQQSICVGNISPATIKAEPGTYSSALVGGTYTGISSIGKNSMTATYAGTVQVAPQSLGVNNNMETNFGLPQQTSSAQKSRQTGYGKIWEGNLQGTLCGQHVFISRLEAYTKLTASAPLIDDWASTMYIERLISQDHMKNKQYTEPDFLVFRAMTQHGLFEQLQEKKLCAVIRLPSQTLLLTASSKVCRLIGLLLPGDMVVHKQQQQQQSVGTGTSQGQVSSPEPKA